MKGKNHIIIAGNYLEYKKFLKNNPQIPEYQSVFGYKYEHFDELEPGFFVHRAGQWWKNPLAYLEIMKKYYNCPKFRDEKDEIDLYVEQDDQEETEDCGDENEEELDD